MRIVPRALGIALLGACVGMMAAAFTSVVLPESDVFPNQPNIADVALFGSIFLTFPSVGLAIAWKRPRNPVAWLFFAIGLAVTMSVFAGEYTSWPVYAGIDLPGWTIVAWMGQWAFTAAATLFLPYALMLFPDGRLPGSRWRGPATLGVTLAAIATVALALRPGPLTEFPDVMNPFGASGALGDVARVVAGWESGPLVYTGALAIGSLVTRFRWGGAARQQVKWVLWPTTVFVVALVTSLANSVFKIAPVLDQLWAVVILTLAALPICAGIAILRYRLYDIDLVIRRTLVYGLVVAVLGAAYVAIALTLTTALSGLMGSQALPVALSTLIIAALFGPVRARVKALVERRFYRSRYDAPRTLQAFASQLRDQVEIEAVGRSLASVAAEAVQPASVGVWVRRNA
jgi:hypothetical protein